MLYGTENSELSAPNFSFPPLIYKSALEMKSCMVTIEIVFLKYQFISSLEKVRFDHNLF